ncbi:hypothetical protein DL93DRAFT_1177302 [Clavulina sp. PMI_390]|nr:hypothetical protein DL93DRAFT_1177302 [Clavulina sp. PMI_390]
MITLLLDYMMASWPILGMLSRVIPSSAGDEVELSHSTVPKVEPLPISLALSEAISRTSHLAPIIKAVIDAHTSTGARRFRAAAEIVLNEIRDRHYRASWKSMERRRDLRKIFVAAQAKKMMFDEANQWWGALPGTEETYNRFSALLREIAEIDRPLFRSLSRQEYRGEIVHISRNCDACKRLVVGTRYTCLLCKDFDLCEACSGLRHKDLTNAHGKLHHDWHPMIRLPRPTVEIWERDIDSFLTIYERLSRGEAHSSEALAKGANILNYRS